VPNPALLAELAPEPLFVVDAAGVLTWINGAGAAVVGRHPGELVGRPVLELVHPDDSALALAALGSAAPDVPGPTVWVRVARGDGSWLELDVAGRDCRAVADVEGVVCAGRPRPDGDAGDPVAGVPIARIVAHASAAVATLDADGLVTGVYGAALRVLGPAADDITGAPLASLVAPPDAEQVRRALERARRAGRASVEVELRPMVATTPVTVRLEIVDTLSDPVVRGFVVTVEDITELHETRSRLRYVATHDPLTGLPNRALLQEHLEQGLAAGQAMALLYIDLDGFKAVNDTWGHQAGDELLRAVASRLGRAVPGGDLVARIGGDEFVVVAAGIADEPSGRGVAERLTAVLREPFGLAQARVLLDASIGVVVAAPGTPVDRLIADADAAMYRAKATRRPEGA